MVWPRIPYHNCIRFNIKLVYIGISMASYSLPGLYTIWYRHLLYGSLNGLVPPRYLFLVGFCLRLTPFDDVTFIPTHAHPTLRKVDHLAGIAVKPAKKPTELFNSVSFYFDLTPIETAKSTFFFGEKSKTDRRYFLFWFTALPAVRVRKACQGTNLWWDAVLKKKIFGVASVWFQYNEKGFYEHHKPIPDPWPTRRCERCPQNKPGKIILGKRPPPGTVLSGIAVGHT